MATASNLGDAPALGETSPITITDTLPEGLRALSIEASAGTHDRLGAISCSFKALSCTFEHSVPSYTQLEVRIWVEVEEGMPSGVLNTVGVEGGGAPATKIAKPLRVAGVGESTPFGIENYELTNEEEGGAPDVQAGSHPFQTTFTTTLNQLEYGTKLGLPEVSPAALAKDLHFRLPPGLVGNPTPFQRCSLTQFFAKPKPTCDPHTVVGVAMITYDEPGVIGLDEASIPVYNLEPTVGEPARFGFLVTPDDPVFVDSAVRSGQDYAIEGIVDNITQTAALISSEVVFWGVPGDSRHDSSRGNGCLGVDGASGCEPLNGTNPPPLFEMPSSCESSLTSTVSGDSWLSPVPTDGVLPMLAEYTPPVRLDGCNRLPFHPSIVVTPDSQEASKPTGLTVDVHNPQDESLNPEGLGEADVKDITVALPQGVAVDPSGGDGLQACSEGLVGFTGFAELDKRFEPGVQTPAFTGVLPGSNASGEPLLPGVNFCANASKVGEATIKTPLLTNPIKGFVYLAAQEENPFGSLVAMYIVAEDPVSGVLVKLPGEVQIMPSGQIVSTFRNTPQAPFEDAEIHFFGGERAPLASPERCGAYTTTAAFTPWSAEPSDEPQVTAHSASTFDITSGPNGSPCPGASLPFDPSLTAGTTSNQAGGFSPFTMTMSRPDGDQHLQSISLHMPPGLSGLLSGVELCPEPQASQGLCGPNSLIGETTVSVGVGGDPFSVKGGRVYITGPYKGAPFGLSIVNPAKAGPYDLESTQAHHPACDCVLVRAKIEVDPITAELTVTSDNEAPFNIPTSLEGIPLLIQHVNVTITRPGFTFNPTSCEKLQITGSLNSAEGANQTLTVPFQATNCAALAFQPSFKVSTSGRTSRKDGASLNVKFSYPKGVMGKDANLGYVKVELPKQLPSRLSTLQKACTAHQFEADPAGCPAQSVVGHAVVHTEVVPVPLQGPAYFVSYGGAKFPELVIVLQGYGVTVDLHGETFIDERTGVTSSTFRTTPDVPFETFELTLPQGEYSALAANVDLCKITKTAIVEKRVKTRSNGRTKTITRTIRQTTPGALTMPTYFTAQNGTTIKQATPIEVTGCQRQKAKKAQTRRRPKH